MWEKIRNSKLARKIKGVGASRAIYVTVVTLLLAVAVLITATAIANRVKKKNAPLDDPGATENQNPDPDKTPSGKDDGLTPGNPNPSNPSTENGDQKGTSTPDDSKDTAVLSLELPVSKSVIGKGYDSTIQVYSATTGDYRIHLGVDMTTEAAAPVYAAADGVISRIWDDPRMGKCLAISHSGDCYTIYKNLGTEFPDDITVGTEVKAGQQIGMVGESAMIELAEEPHLHLEMTVKGLSVDPMTYFSKQALAALGKDTAFEDQAEKNADTDKE